MRLAYIETFRDPEFLYATVPIAIWSEVEMSLAITAGSIATLRPLYRVVAQHCSWKSNVFSTRKSYGVIPYSIKRDRNTENLERADPDGESTTGIVMVDDQAFTMNSRPVTQEKSITKSTNVRIEYSEEIPKTAL